MLKVLNNNNQNKNDTTAVIKRSKGAELNIAQGMRRGLVLIIAIGGVSFWTFFCYIWFGDPL